MGLSEYDPVQQEAVTPASPSTVDDSQQPTRKKRKAWGQPIPEFKVVLGPRKRAKTTEEKEQRKNERVLRNRRAADKSRQRQKAAVADLEARQTRNEQEIIALRNALAQYQHRFGDLPGLSLPPSQDSTHFDNKPSNIEVENIHLPPTPLTFAHTAATPSFSPTSPLPATAFQSPPLAPTLFPAQPEPTLTNLGFEQHEPTHDLGNLDFDVSDLTQYPAAVLCNDLQCQSETSSSKFQHLMANHKLNFNIQVLSLTMLMTIYQTFSTSMLSPMCQILHFLADSFSSSSTEPDFQELLISHFPIIHTLISKPMTETSPAIFRMKLLSRLLACSPRLARLLLAATDRALQAVVSEEDFAVNVQAGRHWASLLTMKWAILRLDKEHRRYRLMVHPDVVQQQEPVSGLARALGQINKIDGVDYVAVEKSSWRWRVPMTYHAAPVFMEPSSATNVH